MTRHVIDRSRRKEASRRRQEYERIEKEELPRPQTKALQTRSWAARSGNRFKAFTDIERRTDS